MGANKTDLAIERASKSCGGERQIIQNFDSQIQRVHHSSMHSHRSSAADEEKIQTDLGEVAPFHTEVSRRHDSFQNIMADPLSTLNVAEFNKWLRKHKRNLLLDAPLLHGEEEFEDEEP